MSFTHTGSPHLSPPGCTESLFNTSLGLSFPLSLYTFLAHLLLTLTRPHLSLEELWIFPVCFLPGLLLTLTMTLGMDFCSLLPIKSVPSSCEAAGFYSQLCSGKLHFSPTELEGMGAAPGKKAANSHCSYSECW